MAEGPHRPVVAVGGILTGPDGRLLVVRRGNPPGQGLWTVPGGRIEPGERMRDAVVREVREETGLEVEVEGIVGVFELVRPDLHLISIDHRVRRVAGEARAGDDAAALAWMGRSELEAASTTAGLLGFLDEHGVVLAP